MPLRILTMNVYNGRADAASFAAALRKHSPDLVAVQELSASVADVLSDWGSSHLLDPRDDTTGMGMAARFHASFDRLSFPYRDPIRVRLDGDAWGLGDVEIINTHVVNPISPPMKRSRLLRQQELAALEELLADDQELTARILVGDFNSSPAWPLYRRLTKLATDGAVAAGTAKRTWGYFPGSPRMLRIDHVFLQGATCSNTQLVKIPGADHRGVLIDVIPVR